MNINDIIKLLKDIPKNRRDEPVFVYDIKKNERFKITCVSITYEDNNDGIDFSFKKG